MTTPANHAGSVEPVLIQNLLNPENLYIYSILSLAMGLRSSKVIGMRRNR